MARYVRAATSADRHWLEDIVFDNEKPLIPSLLVSEHECVDTGLLWSDGTTVLRAPNPIGFGSELDA